MSDKFQVLLAVKDPLIKTVIKEYLLKLYPNSTLIERDNGANSLLDLNQKEIHVAILQQELPILNGLDIVEKCNEESINNVKFILFSSDKKMEYYQKAKELGFVAYLNADNIETEIEECIQSVFNGSCYISKSISKLISAYSKLSEKLARLSQTEKLFLHQIKEGKNVKEISDKLVLSTKSINQITSSICKKIEIPQKDTALLEWAKENQSILN